MEERGWGAADLGWEEGRASATGAGPSAAPQPTQIEKLGAQCAGLRDRGYSLFGKLLLIAITATRYSLG